jgi:glycosyltransferase involved in cell wall biosynthesis
MTDRPLSIVQLVPSLESGGVERGTLEVSRELIRRGHRSVVISEGGRLVEQLVAEGGEHITWPIGRKSARSLGCLPRLRRWLREQDIDILHARSRVPAWVGHLAWRSLPPSQRPRFVTTMHGLNSVNWFSRIMTRGEVVIAVSEVVREYIRANYPDVPDERIRVIHRGVDPQAFPYGYRPSSSWKDAWERTFPHLRGRRLITLAGRITRLKGHHDLLTLLASLKSAGKNVHGLIVGDEDPRRLGYAGELRKRASDLNLTDDVTFLGHRSDIRDLYAISDVVLSLSSTPESFGRTTLEPLALGVPVIGYDHGGVGEILRAVFPAGRVRIGDERQLCDRVAAMLDERPPVPSLQTFRLQTMLDATLSLYAQLAATEPGTRTRSAA